ncbi:PQQ-binding-like beta-propeller repeat protein [Pseudomonadales bacterium]|nr:PQQ-binding-like beta-propeller repeat protein [Pseudomonadales bacterium]
MKSNSSVTRGLTFFSKVQVVLVLSVLVLSIFFQSIFVQAHAADCEETQADLAGAFPQYWGIDEHSTRFVPAEHTNINATNVHQLKLKWAYGLKSNSPRSYPLVTKDTIFFGDSGAGLLALDRETGCVRWRHEDSEADVASAILSRVTESGLTLYFTSRREGVFAVDAATGKTLWKASIDDEPVPLYSGTPLLAQDKIFVPISSEEIGLSLNPFYGCCTTSGGMAAFDATTGEQLWYLPTIEEPAQVIGRHFFFVEEWGPSGVPVWSAPTFDAESGLLFYGTGENYTEPATLTSDAIFAVDAATGQRRWVKQFTAGDTFNMGCVIGGPNCPDSPGPDLDFGAPPVLAKNGRGETVLYAGQKSGHVHAMNPRTGDVYWSKHLSRGGYLGGIHWGIAADEQAGLLYVPISDFPSGGHSDLPAVPGMFALNLSDGTIRWKNLQDTDSVAGFWPGLSAGIVAAQGLVVAGDLAGGIAAYSAQDGSVLWQFDTAKTFTTVNGVPATGASIDSHGPLLVDDLLVVASGYGGVSMQPGNALLVFQLVEDSVDASQTNSLEGVASE